jgi:CheY-like chemotaxis protein
MNIEPPALAAMRVMIVDDNPLNIELASFVLEADGFTVDAAADAAQALDSLSRSQPELILMDIQMPGMDGLELTRRLRADPRTRHLVIVAFTAYAMKGDEARLRAAGCDGYLAKPIDVSSFARSVRGIWQEVQLRRG